MIRVLYVDDEPELLEIGKLYLEESGDISVTTIESAPEALALIKKERFDAVISDYQMPVMDGIVLLKRVRSEGSKIPFIIFTGKGREEIVIEALNSGADFYLQKGGDPTPQFAELRHKLLSSIGLHNAEEKAREKDEELTTVSDQLHHTMDALAEREDLYRTLFHEMINGFAVHEIICDENGIPRNYRFLEVNPAFESMTGLCREEIIGKTVLDVLPDTEPFWIERYGQVALTGSTDHFENYFRVLDKFYEVTAYQNARGQFTTIIADITERKHAERAILDSERRYRNLYQYAQVALFETSLADAKVVACNQRYCDIFGFASVEEAIGKDVLCLYAKAEEREEIKRILREQGFIKDRTVLFINQSSGREFLGQFSARIDPVRDIAEGSIIDVTDRKRAEEEITFKNVILSTEQETSPDGILIVNETGKILNYNQRFIEICGILEDVIASQSNEPTLQSVSEKLGDPEAFLARVTYLYVHKEEKTYEEIVLKDGRVLDRFSAPMFGAEGKYYGRVWYFRDITDRKRAEELLRESDNRVKKKLDALLLPAGDISTLALAEIIDIEEIQSLMNDFYALTHIGIAIMDLQGNVLIATGWQDICTKFHRVHPDTCKNCIESDTVLSTKIDPGTFRTYKCKNNLWDTVTPIMSGENHIGNLFSGQFLFDDEPVDYELFRSQARQYGFDEKEYLAALEQVPRRSRENVNTAMNFYTRFAAMISKLSCGNIQRVRMATERDLCLSSLHESEEKFRSVTENAFDMIALLDLQGNYLYCNPSCASLQGYSSEEMIGKNLFTLLHPDDRENTATLAQEWMHDTKVNLRVSARIAGKDGSYREVDLRITLLTDGKGTPQKILAIGQDITGRQRVEAQSLLKNSVPGSSITADSIVDNNGIITTVNSAFLRMWEYSSVNEAAGKSVVSFFADEQDAVPVLEILNRDGRWEGDFLAIRSGGSTFMSHMTATIILDESGRQAGYHYANLDITGHKRIEEALQESEERYRLFLENFQGIAYQTDGVTGHHILFAGLVERITGYTAEEFLSGPLRWQTLVHADDIDGVSALKTRMISSPSFVADSEYRIICKDGTVRWVHDIGRILARPDDGRIIITGTVYDVTERRHVEESFRETSDYLTNLLDYANGPVIVWDSALHILRFNHASERLTGRRAEDVIGQPVAILFPQKSPESISTMIMKATGGEHWESADIPIVHVNGSIRTVLWKSATLLNKDQTTVVAVIAQGQEITDQKHAEEALRDANKKLTLLSGITLHDINNQLTVLAGYLRILEKKQPDPTLKEHFQKLARSAQQISAMIRFTKEYEKIGINAPVWQDCRTLTDSAATQALLGQVVVKNELPAGTEVFADPLIIKVFFNLMDSAVRYGGRITTIRFSEEESGDDHIIVCEDDGVGIPVEDKEKIFERDFGKNNGLGFFLAREILSISGITIRENGEAGKGARFEIKIPGSSYRKNPETVDRQEEKP